MSKYTTGEVAKLCSVTVRTVQYYDTRGILIPSELSEGGRRLYSEEDLKKMRVICFLRELDFPISGIKKLLQEKEPEKVIDVLIAQQEDLLSKEINEKREQLDKLHRLKKELDSIDSFSVESIGDIAHIMENSKKLRRMRVMMVAWGIIAECFEVSSIILWIKTGLWIPSVVGLAVFVGICVWISMYYFKSVAYICPQCHHIFKPKFKESFWAYHTMKTRRLRCPECGEKSMCVETYSEGKQKP